MHNGQKPEISTLEEQLAGCYETVVIGRRKCFRLADGQIISVGCISSYNAVVIEYAENSNAAKLNQFEDGDCFDLDIYDADTLFEAVLNEIES